MHITTRLSDAGDGRTPVQRLFLWEKPADPEVAATQRQMVQGTIATGEVAIQQAFDS